MNKVKILTDSCSDLTGELLEKYDIDYGRMNTVRDGVTTKASLSWEYYSPHELYEIMRGGERVTTTQVPVDEFQRIFKLYLDKGQDIVYIGCSLKQSGSVNTAKVVADKMLKDYPNQNIYCIDSLIASVGEGMLAIEAAKMAKEGLSASDIAEKIIAKRNFVNEFCTVQSLDSLRKAGRVKASAAFFGNLMGVKPILIADADGYQTPIKKVKGRRNSLLECVNLMKEAIDPKAQTIYFAHADCEEEEVEEIRSMIKEAMPECDIYTCYIGPIIGASVGPDTIVMYAFGKEVTYKAEG